MTPAKIYPFSIPAGGSFPLLVIGDYAKILTSSGPLTLQGDTFGSIGPILAGQGVQDSPFSRLVLEDESGAINNGTILIADNAFIDDRITGEVLAIDGGKIKTANNTAFIAAGGQGILAGNYSHVQLWNPPGSGKNLFVKQVGCSTTGSGFVIRKSIAAIVSPTAAPLAKNIGSGAATVAQVRIEQNAVLMGSGDLVNLAVTPSTYINYRFEEPVLITPGFGILTAPAGIAAAINFVAEYFEETI